MEIPTLETCSSLQQSQEYMDNAKQQYHSRITYLESSMSLPTVQSTTPKIQANIPKLNLQNLSISFSDNKSQRLDNVNRNICGQHNKKYSYTCITCNSQICSDCLTNPARHRGHRFQRISDKIDKMTDWHSYYVDLTAKINFKRDQYLQNLFIIKRIKQEKEKQQSHKIETLQKHMDGLKNYKAECPQSLQEQYNENKNKIVEFNDFYTCCLTQLKSLTKADLIMSLGNELQQQMKLKTQEVHHLQFNPSKEFYNNPIRPNFQHNSFKIKQFSKAKLTKKQIIFPQFSACHSTWRLKAYPGGFAGAKMQERHKGIQYMSVYAQRVDGLLKQGTYLIQFVITSLTQPNLKIKKTFQSQFVRKQSWGYDRFTKICNIYQRGFLSVDDSLQIKVSISPVSFYEANKAINKLIDQKQKMRQENSKKIQNLKKLLLKQKQQQQLHKQQQEMQRQQQQKKMHQFICVQVPQNPQEYEVCMTQPNIANTELIINDESIKTQQNNRISSRLQKQPKIQNNHYSRIRRQLNETLQQKQGALTRNKNSKLPQISLQYKSPGKLIRLISLKNTELIENSRKRYNSRSVNKY